MKRWLILLLLVIPIAQAKGYNTYLLPFEEEVDYRQRISFPHIYPGQTITSEDRFLEDPLRPGSSTVRWTEKGSYSINLDKIHLLRKDYVMIIRSRKGPDIRMLPFETTKIYLEPDYYKIRYGKETFTVWLARYAD